MPELTDIAVVWHHNGALHLVATSDAEDSRGTVWHNWQGHVGRSVGSFLGWFSLGRPDGGVARTAPRAALNTDGRLNAVVVGIDGAAWHSWQTAPQSPEFPDDVSGVTWSKWQSLGRPGGQAIAALVAFGQMGSDPPRLVLFAVTGDGAVWHCWQRSPGGSWGVWHSLGTPGGLYPPGLAALTQDRAGRLELFAVGGDGKVWHRGQGSPGQRGRPWTPWSSLDGPGGQHVPGALAVIHNNDDRLELFTVASDGAVWHRWQRAAGGWSAWESLGTDPGGGFDEVTVGKNADGRLVLVAVATNQWFNRLYQRKQVAAGGWSPWSTLPDSDLAGIRLIESPMLASLSDGKLVLFVHAPAPAVLYHLFQAQPNGDWEAHYRALGPLEPAGSEAPAS